MDGRDVALGGRGGATLPSVLLFEPVGNCKSMSADSSRERVESKGSTPPFSLSFVNSNLRLQMWPEGVTVGSVRGVRPVRAQLYWLMLAVMVDMFVFGVCGFVVRL